MATATVDQNREAEYAKALARAIAEGITVRPVSATGWIATNPTNGSEYYVYESAYGRTLACACKAGENDKYCKHRAATRAYILGTRTDAVSRQAAKDEHAALAAKSAEIAARSELETVDQWFAELGWLGMSKDQRARWLVAHE